MYRKFHHRCATTLALAASALALGGCVQATRHSNTMVFGTNTTFGIKAGTSAGEVPSVVVGYDRQEAVILPLLANTGEVSDTSDDDRNRLSPCNVSAPIEVSGAQYAVHPCSFVAVKGGSLDSYSVLASFGAQFSAESTNPQASGGLAQYFATGMAAQILADRGGASVVSLGTTPARSASDATAAAELFPDESSFAVGSGKAFDEGMVGLRSSIRETNPATGLPAKMRGFLDALRPAMPPSLSNQILRACTASADACIAEVNEHDSFFLDNDRFDAAVAGWSAY